MLADTYQIRDSDNGYLMGWYAKGTFTPQEMIKGIKWSDGNDTFDFYKINESEIKIYHGYMRFVPAPRGSDFTRSVIIYPCNHGKGAFECTIVYRE